MRWHVMPTHAQLQVLQCLLDILECELELGLLQYDAQYATPFPAGLCPANKALLFD